MNGEQLVHAARELYIGQFRDFVQKRRHANPRGAPELMLSVENNDGTTTEEFGGLVVIDYAEQNGEQTRFWEFEPPAVLPMSPVEGRRGALKITIDSFRWDNVFVFPTPAINVSAALKPWFDRWFDQGGKRYQDGAEFAGVIHRLIVKPNYLSIDFGTAPVEAFPNLMDTLVMAGVTAVRVRGNDAPPT